MAWYLDLQGPVRGQQSLCYQLQDSADVETIAQEMSSSATIDRAVAVPAVLHNDKNVTLYVRPTAWGVWAFYEMSEDERSKMPTGNQLLEALTEAARQQKGKSLQR